MSSLIVLFSIVILCSRGVNSDDVTKALKPENTMILKNNDSHSLAKEISWSSLLSKRLESMNIKNTEKHENDKINTMEMFNKRKSKFLGSLAFLAGLGFGGLAGAASSTVKAYAKLPQASIAMNFLPSKQGSYLAAYYDPYPFVPHPYLYHTPLGFYPFLDPLKLQSLISGSSQQNGADRPDQIITVLGDKRPSDSDDSEEEEYIVEKKKTDKSKSSSRFENRVESAESLISSSVNRKTEGEMTNKIVTCETQKKSEEKAHNVSNEDTTVYDFEDLQEDADNSRATTNRRKTKVNNSTTSRPNSDITTISDSTSQSTTINVTMTNSTTMKSNTTFSPFFGYYDGNPQNIDNIDLTSDMLPPVYQEHNPINYHLPYERPANFYPDERYNFYSNSFPNSYPSGPFFSEHLSDYSSNDFDRYVYPSDNNSPPYVNQFKPLKYN